MLSPTGTVSTVWLLLLMEEKSEELSSLSELLAENPGATVL